MGSPFLKSAAHRGCAAGAMASSVAPSAVAPSPGAAAVFG
jgi:hypothetical protein